MGEEKVGSRGREMRFGLRAQHERRGLAMGPALNGNGARVLTCSVGTHDETYKGGAQYNLQKHFLVDG